MTGFALIISIVSLVVAVAALTGAKNASHEHDDNESGDEYYP